MVGRSDGRENSIGSEDGRNGDGGIFSLGRIDGIEDGEKLLLGCIIGFIDGLGDSLGSSDDRNDGFKLAVGVVDGPEDLEFLSMVGSSDESKVRLGSRDGMRDGKRCSVFIIDGPEDGPLLEGMEDDRCEGGIDILGCEDGEILSREEGDNDGIKLVALEGIKDGWYEGGNALLG